ncbi:unnamed protein product [Callosobruchus maculatus]|uniref:Uncharacterized protein n=1 Tax=Callosobruchus maculatus TaxID=64391 RepID=A0A653DAX6_CALMS|nr:unnamed protein product [Callosobruchus maculatus]
MSGTLRPPNLCTPRARNFDRRPFVARQKVHSPLVNTKSRTKEHHPRLSSLNRQGPVRSIGQPPDPKGDKSGYGGRFAKT